MKRRDFITKAGVGVAAGVAGAATLSAPAIADGHKELNIVSTWPRDFPGLGLSAQRLAARITELSNGKLKCNYFAAGEKVGAFDVFDEVASGNSQAYIAADYYWKGKHPGFAYFTSVPFGMTTVEWNAWIKFGGGQELWDEMSGEFGLKALPCGGTGTQAGGWFNKEINSSEDLKGLKMRIPGLGGTVMSKLGASPVSLPGGQIYENLVSGSIDATEWVGPYNDYFMKFYEAAKYYYTGGMHEPGSCLALAFNASFWGKLTSNEKALITAASMEEHAAQYEETCAKNGEYLTKLINEHGTKVRSFNDDVWDAFGEAAAEVFEETRNHSALAKKIDGAYQSFLKECGSMMAKFEISYVNQRNRVLDLS
jgi:TRAP-type mannitol/chloroaromatic compound transport system substrate-binding protein